MWRLLVRLALYKPEKYSINFVRLVIWNIKRPQKGKFRVSIWLKKASLFTCNMTSKRPTLAGSI